MESPPPDPDAYAHIIKSIVPPWSLRHMDTIESRWGFVDRIDTAARRILSKTGSMDVQIFSTGLLKLADIKSIVVIDEMEERNTLHGKNQILLSKSIKELIKAVSQSSLISIASVEELTVFLLVVDVPASNVHKWVQSVKTTLGEFPPVSTHLDLQKLVEYL